MNSPRNLLVTAGLLAGLVQSVWAGPGHFLHQKASRAAGIKMAQVDPQLRVNAARAVAPAAVVAVPAVTPAELTPEAVSLAVAPSPAATAQGSQRFDINRDGRINAADAAELAMMLQPAGASGSMPTPPGSVSRYDLNADGRLSLYDWVRWVHYASQVGAHEQALFDVTGAAGIDARDVADFAMRTDTGRRSGGAYSFRHDVNADGRVDGKDWMLLVGYLVQTKPQVLLDFTGDGVLNGGDLDSMAQTIDARSFDPRMDLDGDGRLTAEDWRKAVQMVSAVSPRALFDVDGKSGRSQPVLTRHDNARIAAGLNGLGVGFPVSIRFDLNGDGRVSSEDWAAWVRFATLVYKTPDLLMDLNNDGQVGGSDQALLYATLGAVPLQHGFDLNGDGKIDWLDSVVMLERINVGPLQLLKGDVNRDGCVTDDDRVLVQRAQGVVPGWPMWDPDLDVDGNQMVDANDLVWISQNSGRCR